jgi:hypothetical protein
MATATDAANFEYLVTEEMIDGNSYSETLVSAQLTCCFELTTLQTDSVKFQWTFHLS